MSKLYRSNRDKMVSGLCGGLADVIGMDSTLLRILVLISVPFTGGTTLLIYFIAALVVPKEYTPPFNPYQGGPGYNGQGYNGQGYSGQNYYGGQGQGNQGAYNQQSYQQGNYNAGHPNQGQSGINSQSSNLDEMMKDIKKKALEKEVEELRKKLSKYEKGEV